MTFRMSRVVLVTATIAGSLMLTTSARADAPTAQKLVPLRASASGTMSIVVAPPIRIVTATAEGQGSHLGNLDMVINIATNMTPVVVPDCQTLGSNEVNTSTFTAANGDTFTVAGTGTNCPTGPTTVTSRDTVQVTGGTGRFQGASGTIEVRGAIDRATSTFNVTYEGTISTPGSR